jgi:ABC-type branched-subunit amino acid transport system substrate-binding protein
MRRLRLVLLAVGIAGASLALTSCGGGGGGTTGTLTIGDLIPLTGDLSDFGPPGEKAASVAADQINKAAKSTGADISGVKILTEDSQTDPTASVSAARKMSDEGATCIAGEWASADTIPVARSVAIPDGILEISPASTSDEITGLDDNGLINRTAPPDSFQGPTLANAIEKDIGGAKGKTVNIGARNDSYGTGLTDTFSAAWEAKGGKIGQKVIYDPNASSYDSEAQKIVSGNPDAVVIIDFPETFVKVGPALERTGSWDPTTAFGTDGLASSSLPKDVGVSTVEGMRGTAPGVPSGAPASKAFNTLYTSSAPKNVDRQTFDAQNFDAVVLCYLAAVAAGSTDGQDMADHLIDITAPPGTKYTWEQLPEAIKALQNGDDIDYVGASGPVDMNSAGDTTAGVYEEYEYKNGTLTLPVADIPIAKPTSGG